MATNPALRSMGTLFDAAIPSLKRLYQFSKTGVKLGKISWCRWRDSNPHDVFAMLACQIH